MRLFSPIHRGAHKVRLQRGTETARWLGSTECPSKKKTTTKMTCSFSYLQCSIYCLRRFSFFTFLARYVMSAGPSVNEETETMYTGSSVRRRWDGTRLGVQASCAQSKFCHHLLCAAKGRQGRGHSNQPAQMRRLGSGDGPQVSGYFAANVYIS